MLNPTPTAALLDERGRPYFLSDCELTLDRFCAKLDDPNPDLRAYLVAKLMRQARPDDVFTFVTPSTVLDLWSSIEPHLGSTLPFWTWVFDVWRRQGTLFDVSERASIDGALLAIEEPFDGMLAKVCAVLSRSQVRELAQFSVMDREHSLARTIAEARRQNARFSTLTLAWELKGLSMRELAEGLDWDESAIVKLEGYQAQLAERLAAAARPRPTMTMA